MSMLSTQQIAVFTGVPSASAHYFFLSVESRGRTLIFTLLKGLLSRKIIWHGIMVYKGEMK